MVSLARLAGSRRAVLYLLTMPAAVFLMVGYAECLFLALAVPAWHAATRGRWWRAAVLAGLSGLVRVDAVFLVLALAVMALAGPRPQVPPALDLRALGPARPRLGPPRLAAPRQMRLSAAAPSPGPAAYEVYLRAGTGTWNAWVSANQAGWFLHTVTPVQALKATYWVAFQHVFAGGVAFEYQLEIAVEAVMILAALAFLCCRRWPEAVYCGLPALVVGTQTLYQSGPRTLLLLFPVCVALARLDARRPWIRYLYLGIMRAAGGRHGAAVPGGPVDRLVRAQQSKTDQQMGFRSRWSSSTSSRIAAGSWSRCHRHSARPAASASPSGAAARAALIA